jgi:hypothetical protein
MEQCCGIKKCGTRCETMIIDGTRCGIHKRTMEKVGPNQIRRYELKLVHDRNLKLLRMNLEMRLITREDYDNQILIEKISYQTKFLNLQFLIRDETIANGNQNADIPYRERERERRRQIQELVRQRWEQREARHQQRVQMHAQAQAFNNQLNAHDQQALQGMGVQAQIHGELRQFANDNQNIHTSIVVQKVKDTVTKILKIQVPIEYHSDTLKTLGEIILDCKLSKKAAQQMTVFYCNDSDIYELGKGIYANVLNSIWQYIKSSENSEDLKKILRNEMEDNIGMCAQGNLSRICNILSGYLDGLVVDTRSINEIIGTKLIELMKLEDVRERLVQARAFLDLHKIPKNDWREWLLPLIEQEEDPDILKDIPGELLA